MFADGTEFEQCMAQLAKDLHLFYRAFDNQPLFMSRQAQQRVADLCISFGTHFQWCREWSRTTNLLAFNTTPKVHKMQHLPFFCGILNPFLTSCYMDEPQIGTTCKCWQRSVAGRYHRVAQKTVLAKRLLGFLLRLDGVD